VGISEGDEDEDGFSVGIVEGDEDGYKLGWIEGDIDGTMLGPVEGLPLGAGVGCIVGEEVGLLSVAHAPSSADSVLFDEFDKKLAENSRIVITKIVVPATIHRTSLLARDGLDDELLAAVPISSSVMGFS